MKLELAQKVVEAALNEARSLGLLMNVAVVDEGGNLMAFARMEGAWLGSIAIAQAKAYSARAFDMTTQELGALSQPGQPLFGIEATNSGQIVIFGGGIPLRSNGTVIGAIGVSGGTPDQDHQVAQAGLKAL